MRPEEAAAQQTIKQAEQPKKALKMGESLALTAFGGYGASALASRIIPFLSKYIPAGLAAKGLSKLDPRINKFFTGVFGSGYTVDEGLEFLREKLMPQQQAQQSSPQQKSPRAGPLFLGSHGAVPGSLREQLQGEQPVQQMRAQQQVQQQAPTPQQTQAPQQAQALQQNGPGAQALLNVLQQLNQKLGQ